MGPSRNAKSPSSGVPPCSAPRPSPRDSVASRFVRPIDPAILRPDPSDRGTDDSVPIRVRRQPCRVPSPSPVFMERRPSDSGMPEIGSIPYRSRFASIESTVASLGGRTPPGRKTPRPSAESRSRVSAHDSPAPAPSAVACPRSSRLHVGPCRVRIGAPSSAASLLCGRSSMRSTTLPPTAMRTRPDAPTPSGRQARVPRVSICSVFP